MWPETTVNGVTTDYTLRHAQGGAYNSLDQLISAGSVTYDYDDRGNLYQVIDGAQTITYKYDDANRLIEVNSVTYTWDDNGNLLNDGVNAYTNDSANRMKTLTGSSVAASYNYNGLGDRMQETVNGIPTTFTMDLNAGLTQALSDGTNTYIYGVDRIAQATGTGTEYFLGDALGSVRQLTDQTGAITYARAYDPYGVVTQTMGSAQTAYGFTNEYSDSYIKLIYLRSRMYDPTTGRFPTKDSWLGDYNRPLSLNHWMYVDGNPINATDPSGYMTEKEAADADKIVKELRTYNVKIGVDWGYRPIPYFSLLPESVQSIYPSGCYWEDGNWRNLDELKLTQQGVQAMATKLGGADKFRSALAGLPITFWRMPGDFHSDGMSVAWTILDIKIYNKTFDYGDLFARGTVVHELAHVWDTRQTPIFSLSSEMSKKTKSYRFICPSVWSITCPYEFDPNGLEDPPTDYGKQGEREDFADSFAICVYPTYKSASSLNLFPIRKNYIEGLINGNKCSQ